MFTWRCILWCMHRTNLYLEDRQTIALDAMARAQGLSRAEVVRRLIDDALFDGASRLDGDLDAIIGAFGVAPDFPMPDRSDGERQRWIDQMLDEA